MRPTGSALGDASGAPFSLRDELGSIRAPITLDALCEFLADESRRWTHGSGDCGLFRRADGALLSFVRRPPLGVLIVYEDLPLLGDQYVFAPSGASGELTQMWVGGEPATVPRDWFVPLDEAYAVLERFFQGARFPDGDGWDDYLVNPDPPG